MAREAGVMCGEARDAIQDSYYMRQRLTPLLERMAREDPGFLSRYWHSMLTAMLDAAMQITSADMGNLQLFDASTATLHIEAERAFSAPFLRFFGSVQSTRSACGAALQSRRQVVVEDVADSPIFWGTPGLEVMLDAGARSVQSTPLIGCSGAVLGMISTHWDRPWRPSGQTLLKLQLLSRTAAEWLEARSHLAPIDGNPVWR